MPQAASHAAVSGAHPVLALGGRILSYGILVFWALICLFPLYWVAVTSLKDPATVAAGPRFVPFVDFTPTAEAWRFILADPSENLLRRFFNSAVVGVSATFLTLLIGAMAVYGLSRFRYAVPARAAALGVAALLAAGLAVSAAPPGVRLMSVLAAAALLVLAARSRSGRPALGNRGLLIAILVTRILPPVGRRAADLHDGAI